MKCKYCGMIYDSREEGITCPSCGGNEAQAEETPEPAPEVTTGPEPPQKKELPPLTPVKRRVTPPWVLPVLWQVFCISGFVYIYNSGQLTDASLPIALSLAGLIMTWRAYEIRRGRDSFLAYTRIGEIVLAGLCLNMVAGDLLRRQIVLLVPFGASFFICFYPSFLRRRAARKKRAQNKE